jgi:general secretion pathway protein F
MSTIVRNWWAEYLLPLQETPDAPEESSSPGWFRHRRIVASDTKAGVVAEIIQRGAVPVSVKPVRKPLPFLDRVARTYKQEFLIAIRYNMENGLSAGKAFIAVAEGETGAARERLDLGIRVLQTGGQFSDALKAIDFFDDSTLAIIAAGERTGSTRQSIDTAIEHYDSWAAGMKAVMGMATMVAIDLFSAASTAIGVRYQLIPMLSENGIKSEDPAKIATFKTSIELATLSNDILIWLAVLVTIAIIYVGGAYAAGDEKAKVIVAKVSRRTPYLRDALKHSALATSAQVLSSLLKGGVTFTAALDIVQRGVTQPDIADYWISVRRRINRGESVASAMSSAILSNTERLAVAAHSNQRQLGETLLRISKQRSTMAQKMSKKFTYLGIGVTSLYIAASLAVAMYVLKLQSATMMPG